ncbi:hypothetical protein AMTR_s00061p00144830 [Amborella trichopoda]|uniref:Uncharacterized protein n=1 Tax=Amborella trichopoda TaxID=13333 RepID=U5DFD1_AMBTC|nr:hypothetical protein AMTR_s00061p00144830 [Amborella trichopoda]
MRQVLIGRSTTCTALMISDAINCRSLMSAPGFIRAMLAHVEIRPTVSVKSSLPHLSFPGLFNPEKCIFDFWKTRFSKPYRLGSGYTKFYSLFGPCSIHLLGLNRRQVDTSVAPLVVHFRVIKHGSAKRLCCSKRLLIILNYGIFQSLVYHNLEFPIFEYPKYY